MLVLRRLLACALALRALGAGAPLWAQSAASRDATRLTEQAYDLQRRGALNDAIRLYEQALALEPLPKRYRNLAIPLERAGRLVEALRALHRFQRDQLGEPPEDRQEVAERVSRLEARLGRLRLSAPEDPEARGAEVELRVREAGGERPRCVADEATAGQFWCEPGPVQAELWLRGQQVAVRGAVVQLGAVASARFALRGAVRITSNRGAPRLWIDKTPLVLQPPARLPLTLPLLLGAHDIDARDGREALAQRVVAREGALVTVDLRFRPSRAWVYWLVGGVVAAAAVTTVAVVATRPAPPGGADVRLDPPQ